MNTCNLQEIGSRLVPNFAGVFAVDKVPHYNSSYSFIVNNQSSNLPGQHWLAVSIKNNNAFIFDPLGLPPPSQLTHQLRAYKIHYNTEQYQPTNSTLCGQFALSWLINNT